MQKLDAYLLERQKMQERVKLLRAQKRIAFLRKAIARIFTRMGII